MKKKQSFMLVEFLVAFLLFAAVVTALFGTYSFVQRTAAARRKIEQKGEAVRLAHAKLHSLFAIVRGYDPQEKDIFYTVERGSSRESGTSLIFLSYNSGDRDEAFNASMLTKLFFDSSKKEFVAVSFKDPNKFPSKEAPDSMRIEPLLDKVTAVQFSFWMAPSMKKHIAGKQFPHDQLGIWQTGWSADYKIRPTLLRIQVEREGEKEPIIFDFVVSKNIGVLREL